MRITPRFYLFDLDLFCICLTQRELISAHSKLDRVAQRSNLTDRHRDTLRNAHIHNSASDRAFAIKLNDLKNFAPEILKGPLSPFFPSHSPF